METKLKEKYGLATAIAMVVGIVIGSGVFFKAEKILNVTGGDQKLAQAVVLLLRAVAPVDIGGLGQRGDLRHPGDQSRMLDVRRHVQALAFHRGVIHDNSNRLA